MDWKRFSVSRGAQRDGIFKVTPLVLIFVSRTLLVAFHAHICPALIVLTAQRASKHWTSEGFSQRLGCFENRLGLRENVLGKMLHAQVD